MYLLSPWTHEAEVIDYAFVVERSRGHLGEFVLLV